MDPSFSYHNGSEQTIFFQSCFLGVKGRYQYESQLVLSPFHVCKCVIVLAMLPLIKALNNQIMLK